MEDQIKKLEERIIGFKEREKEYKIRLTNKNLEIKKLQDTINLETDTQTAKAHHKRPILPWKIRQSIYYIHRVKELLLENEED